MTACGGSAGLPVRRARQGRGDPRSRGHLDPARTGTSIRARTGTWNPQPGLARQARPDPQATRTWPGRTRRRTTREAGTPAIACLPGNTWAVPGTCAAPGRGINVPAGPASGTSRNGGGAWSGRRPGPAATGAKPGAVRVRDQPQPGRSLERSSGGTWIRNRAGAWSDPRAGTWIRNRTGACSRSRAGAWACTRPPGATARSAPPGSAARAAPAGVPRRPADAVLHHDGWRGRCRHGDGEADHGAGHRGRDRPACAPAGDDIPDPRARGMLLLVHLRPPQSPLRRWLSSSKERDRSWRDHESKLKTSRTLSGQPAAGARHPCLAGMSVLATSIGSGTSGAAGIACEFRANRAPARRQGWLVLESSS